MDLLSYFRVLRRRWFVILVLVVVGAGIGVASTELESESATVDRTYYKATTTLVLADDLASGTPVNLDQVALFATTGPVPDAAAAQVGEDSGRELAERITTLTNQSTRTVAITAVDPDPSRAVELADAFSSALITSVTEEGRSDYEQDVAEAQARIDELNASIAGVNAQTVADPANQGLQSQLSLLNVELAAARSELEQVQDSEPALTPLSALQDAQSIPIGQTEYRNRIRLGQQGLNNLQANTPEATALAEDSADSTRLDGPLARGILGALFGLLAGVALAMLLEKLDRKVRTHEDVEAAFGLPVLADVPKLSSKQQSGHTVVSFAEPLSRTAEAYRSVRSSLLFQLASSSGVDDILRAEAQLLEEDAEHHEPVVIMVTSAAPKEGKTTTSANLAAVFAEVGASVLVVNCDFRRPMVHRYLGVADEPRRVHNSVIPGVKVVTNVVTETDPNPARVVAAQRKLIDAAKAQFDVVLLDTAPLLSANDAVELVGETDMIVLVARSEISTSPSAQRAMEVLGRVDAPTAGVVLVGSAEATNDYYGYYYYNRTTATNGHRTRAQRKAEKKAEKAGRSKGKPTMNGHTASPSEPTVDPRLLAERRGDS